MRSGAVAAGGMAPSSVGRPALGLELFGVLVGLGPFVGVGSGSGGAVGGGPPPLLFVGVGSGVMQGTTGADGSGETSAGGQGPMAVQTSVGLNRPPQVAPYGWKLRL